MGFAAGGFKIMKRFGLISGALALTALPGTLLAQTSWLHVRVEEPRKQTKVAVNLPLAVVEAALRAAPEKIASKGRVHLGCRHEHGAHVAVADLKKMWAELKSAGDTDFVTVEEEDANVRVARVGSTVQIRVQGKGRKAEEVHVDVPVAVVDALLSGDGDDLDVRAAVAEIKKLRGDIVRVKDDDTTVRIWIDERN
jgi:hypothetical protein